MIQFYEYKKCSTCRNAAAYLEKRKIPFQRLAIRETPPSAEELKKMLQYTGGEIRKIMNTSGLDYKALGLKDKMDGMSESEIFKLLGKNGNLVKRPFVLGKNFGVVGFKEEEWDQKVK
ncbi:MAG: arsenate reductase family protein [Verrucomicrobiota bacterium]